MLTHLPKFVRVFYRLMKDPRVSVFALVLAAPFVILLLMFSPPAIELDFVPVLAKSDLMLAAYIALKLFIWLCPADVVREHVGQIAHGQ